LWDTETGQSLASFADSPGPVQGVAFSPNGRVLAAISHDAAVQLWHAATEEEVVAGDP
jgi:WD40 repeat protein